jgi:hypothetical protein
VVGAVVGTALMVVLLNYGAEPLTRGVDVAVALGRLAAEQTWDLIGPDPAIER